MSSIAVASSKRPTQADLSASLTQLNKSVATDIANGTLKGDAAKAASANVTALTNSFSALSSAGPLRASDVAALNQRVSGANKLLAQTSGQNNQSPAGTSSLPAATTPATTPQNVSQPDTKKAPGTQAEVQTAVRQLRENLSAGIANGTLSGDAAKAAAAQVQKLSDTLNAQSSKGALSSSQISDLGKQISTAQASVSPTTTASTTGTTADTSASASTGATSTSTASTATTSTATTSTSTTSASSTGTSSATGSTTSSASTTSTATTSQTASDAARLKAQQDALQTLTQITQKNFTSFSNALGASSSSANQGSVVSLFS